MVRVRMLMVLALVAGCGSDGDSNDAENEQVGSLEEECEASCENQTGCPNDLPLASCSGACVGLGEMFPECEPIWNRLNDCMSRDNLECDSQGGSATSNPDCLDLAEQFGTCLGGS